MTHEAIEEKLVAADAAGERTDAIRAAALTRYGKLDRPATLEPPATPAAVVAPQPPAAAALAPAELSDDEWLAQAGGQP